MNDVIQKIYDIGIVPGGRGSAPSGFPCGQRG